MDKSDLKEMSTGLGADFFGVADLELFKGWPTIPENLLTPFVRAISLGVALSRDIFENLVDGPTPHYWHHYSTVNALLDHVALRLTNQIQRRGGRAVPVPASQILDWNDWQSAITHKAVARMAGLGWQGKSLLLVNPEVGPRIRLVTILTDLELAPDQPLPNGCGKCQECTKACPAGAIKGALFGTGYQSREEAVDMKACAAKLAEFNQRTGTQHWICGMCIKACPIGHKPKIFKS